MKFVSANAVNVMESYSNGILRSIDEESLEENEKQDNVEGFTIGNIGLFPQTIGATFLSPSWGGMNYLREGKSGQKSSDCIEIARQTTEEDKISL